MTAPKNIITVLDPYVGDTMVCPGCGDKLKLTGQDGWSGPHLACVGRTTHHDWIITVFSDPSQENPLDRPEPEQ